MIRTRFEERSLGRSQSMQRHSRELVLWRLVCAALVLLILNCLGPAYASDTRAPKFSAGSGAPVGRVAGNYGQVPLSFEPNLGQSDTTVQFLARGSGYSLFLTPGEAVLSLERTNAAAADTLRMQLLGADTTAKATGLEPHAGVINYFVGNDAKRWHTGIPTYGKVNFANIYPGIDLVFYGNQRQLEYDFVVKAGGDSSRIAWSFRGAQPRLGKDGILELSAPGFAPGGAVRFLAPVAFQVFDGERRPVAVSYAVGGETVRFALGSYDHSQPLVIDPVLSYFSYLGGTGNDYIGNSVNQGVGSPSPEPTQSVGIDSLGNLYVAGSTSSIDFPVASPAGTMKTKNSGQTWAFVSKFNPDGSKLLYSTYIGGSAGGNDAAWALAVDSTGNAYVTGAAQTNDFPVTAGAFQTVCAPIWDNLTNAEAASCTSNTQNAFALKLNPTGSKLIYSSFLGGQGGTWGTGIAVDSAGQAYLTGVAQANGCGGPAYLYGAQYGCFPTTANAVISDIGGGNPIDMAFMTVFNATGSALVYSTLFGDIQGGVSVKGAGCMTDCGAGTYGTSIGLDPLGNVYIGGRTVAANMLTTKGAFNTLGSGPIPSTPQILVSPNGYGYVAKFAPVTASGTSLVYSTYFGGGAVYGGDVGGLAGDSSGNVYITGDTHAPDFPATTGAWQTTCDPNQLPTWCNQGAYVAKLNATGTEVVWATYLGNGSNAPLYFLGPVILDSAGDVYVLGEGSGQLPLGGGKVSSLNGPNTVYAAKFNSTGSQVLFGATVGGPGNGPEKAGGMAVDALGDIYVGGAIGSGGSFATAGAFQQAYAGGGADAFVAKVIPLQPSTTTLTLSASSGSVGQQITLTAKVAGPQGSTVVPTGTVTFLSGTTTLGTGKLDSTGTATYSSSSFAAATFTLTASYGGDGVYSSSTSSAQTLVITAATVATTTTLASSASTVISGAGITFTATVSPVSGSTVATGNVTFKDGSATLGTGALDASGKATYTTSTLSVGSHSIAAVYGGDGGNLSSTSAALTITVNAAPVADFSLSLSPTSATVTGGSSATVTVTVTPINGFNAATTFACSGLPANSTCSFSPASVTPNGTAAATSTLTIASNVKAALAMAGGFLAFLLLPLAGRRNRGQRSLLVVWFPALLLILVAAGMSACGAAGGGIGGISGGTKTPTGTYSVTVTATSGNLSHAAKYSLTVQ